MYEVSVKQASNGQNCPGSDGKMLIQLNNDGNVVVIYICIQKLLM